MATEAVLQRGDVISNPSALHAGDVVAIIDKDSMLAGMPCVMARIAITTCHSTSAVRRAHTGIANAVPDGPTHFHGVLSYAASIEQQGNQSTQAYRAIISMDTNTLHITQHTNGSAFPDLPDRPLYVYDGTV
jgi:hypothetical protein